MRAMKSINKILSLKRSAASSALTFAALLTLSACQGNDALNPLNQVVVSSVTPDGVNVNFCTDPAYDQKQYLKTIVILDHSGSNQENYQMAADGSGAPALVNGTIVINSSYATDPTGQTRYGTVNTPGTLLNYLSTLPANSPTDPTRFFALIDFNDQATTYPANAAGFTSDTAAFYNYVLQDSTSGTNKPTDGGSTSYLSALAKAYSIMSSDIQSAQKCAALGVGSASPGSWCPVPGKPNTSSYVIVFMSDGSPITNISGVGTDANGNIVVTGAITITKESSTDILGEVGAITALASNAQYVSSINLFTIYYYAPGNVDLSGQTLLANMAKAGNGIAYNALSGSNIDYSQFQPPAKRIKYTLSDIFVSNASVTWWTDAQMHLDTDMDGLPDDVETAWGSNPLKASSDNNGVSDLVKYRLTNAQACTHKNAQGLCADAVVNYASGQCSGIKTKMVNGVLTFTSSDPDGLNDCEKFLLGDVGGIGNPDSNDDSIPDWLEFINALPFQVGTVPSINTISQDGYSLYQKIKLSLPLNVSVSQMLNYTPATYALAQVSTSANQDCYNLQVNGLPKIGDGNTVRVDVIEKSDMLPENPLYRIGKKQFAPGSSAIQFADWNNSAEQALGTWQVSQ
jgi:hypothetical protein